MRLRFRLNPSDAEQLASISGSEEADHAETIRELIREKYAKVSTKRSVPRNRQATPK